MKQIVFKLFLTSTLIIASLPAAWAQEDSYNFERDTNALGEWKINKNGGTIEIVPREKGMCVRISRKDRHDFTYISKEYKLKSPKPKSMRFEAEIKAENIQQGQERYHQGIFQAVLMSGGKEIAHPKVKFDGTFEFTPMEFEAQDLDNVQSVVLRIGLQNAKGTMWVDNVKVFIEE